MDYELFAGALVIGFKTSMGYSDSVTANSASTPQTDDSTILMVDDDLKVVFQLHQFVGLGSLDLL